MGDSLYFWCEGRLTDSLYLHAGIAESVPSAHIQEQEGRRSENEHSSEHIHCLPSIFSNHAGCSACTPGSKRWPVSSL